MAPVEDVDATAARRLLAEATALAENGAFGRAAELFARAAEAAEGAVERAKAHEARAQCLLELGEADDAAASAALAAGARPGWAAGHATWGRALRNAGRLEDAVERLEVARSAAASEGDAELAEELRADVAEVRGLLERHWAEHHDVVLPGEGAVRPRGLRIRQSLNCGYCRLGGGEQGPGGAVWAAGVVLAQAILAQQLPVAPAASSSAPPRDAAAALPWAGARVLELGAGTGIVGLAAAAAGAEVLMTDHEPLLPLMRLNADLNRELLAGSPPVDCAAFDWQQPPPDAVRRPWDLIIAADLVYAFAAVAPFADALAAVLVGAPGRPAFAPRAVYAHNPRSDDLDAELRRALAAKGLRAVPFDFRAWRAEPVGRIGAEALQRVAMMEIAPAPHEGAP